MGDHNISALDEIDKTEMVKILALRTCWSRNHEVSFRYFRTLARRSAGKGHLLRSEEDQTLANQAMKKGSSPLIPNMEGGRATLLALFLIYCPSVLAELNLNEEQRVGEMTGLEVLAESNSYFRDENISWENVIAQGSTGREIGCTVMTLTRGISRALPERMKTKHEILDYQIEFGLLKCFASKHFYDGFKETRKTMNEIQVSLKSKGLPVSFITRAISLARSELVAALNTTIYSADPVRDKELGDVVIHGCCRDAGGEAITTTLMLALQHCPPEKEDVRSLLLVARAVTHLPMRHITEMDEHAKKRCLLGFMLLSRSHARDMSTRTSAELSVAVYKFFTKQLIQQFSEARATYLKNSHKESGAKWRKRDIAKCRCLAFRRELEVTKVILDARDKEENEFLGGIKKASPANNGPFQNRKNRQKLQKKLNQKQEKFVHQNKNKDRKTLNPTKRNTKTASIIESNNMGKKKSEVPSKLAKETTILDVPSNVQDDDQNVIDLPKSPLKEDDNEDNSIEKDDDNRVKGGDKCIDVIGQEVTPLEISRLREKWSETTAPSPLGRGAPRVPFVDPQPGDATNLSRHGLLASPRGRKFTTRGAAAAAAVALSAEEVANLITRERKALGEVAEGFNVQGFMNHHDDDIGEATRRAVLRSASSSTAAVTEEALAAAAADAPTGKYSMTHNIGSAVGNQTGRTQGTGSGLLSSADPADLVPHDIAASAVRLDNCSSAYKKRLEVVQKQAKEIEDKQKAANLAIEAARVARRRSFSSKKPDVPIPTTTNIMSSTHNNNQQNNSGVMNVKKPISGSGKLSHMFQHLNEDEPEGGEQNDHIAPKTANAPQSELTSIHQNMSPAKRLQFAVGTSNRRKSVLQTMMTAVQKGAMLQVDHPATPTPKVVTGSRFDLHHFVDSYGAYAVTVKMRGGGPGYRHPSKIGISASDRDNAVAAASLIQRSFRLRAHRRYLWACAYFRVPLHVAFLFHRVSLPSTENPTDFFSDKKRYHQVMSNSSSSLKKKDKSPIKSTAQNQGSHVSKRVSMAVASVPTLSLNNNSNHTQFVKKKKKTGMMKLFNTPLDDISDSDHFSKIHEEAEEDDDDDDDDKTSKHFTNNKYNHATSTNKISSSSYLTQRTQSSERRASVIRGNLDVRADPWDDVCTDVLSYHAVIDQIQQKKSKSLNRLQKSKLNFKESKTNKKEQTLKLKDRTGNDNNDDIPEKLGKGGKNGIACCAHVGERWHSHFKFGSPLWPDRLVSALFAEKLVKELGFLSPPQEAHALTELQQEFRKYRTENPVILNEFQKQSKLKFRAGVSVAKTGIGHHGVSGGEGKKGSNQKKPRILSPSIQLAPTDDDDINNAVNEEDESMSSKPQKKKWFLELVKPSKAKMNEVIPEDSILITTRTHSAANNSKNSQKNKNDVKRINHPIIHQKRTHNNDDDDDGGGVHPNSASREILDNYVSQDYTKDRFEGKDVTQLQTKKTVILPPTPERSVCRTSSFISEVGLPRSQHLQAALLGRRRSTMKVFKKSGLKGNKLKNILNDSIDCSSVSIREEGGESLGGGGGGVSSLKALVDVLIADKRKKQNDNVNKDQEQKTVISIEPPIKIVNPQNLFWKKMNNSKIQPELTEQEQIDEEAKRMSERKMVVVGSAASSVGVPWLIDEEKRKNDRNDKLRNEEAEVFINSSILTFDAFYEWWLVQLRLSESSSRQMRALYKAAHGLWLRECKLAGVTPKGILLPPPTPRSKPSQPAVLNNPAMTTSKNMTGVGALQVGSEPDDSPPPASLKKKLGRRASLIGTTAFVGRATRRNSMLV